MRGFSACRTDFKSVLHDGLRYNTKAITGGAQTECRGDAGPVRVLLGGGHAPAALLFDSSIPISASALPAPAP